MTYKKLFLGKNKKTSTQIFNNHDLINELKKHGWDDNKKIIFPKQIHSNKTFIIDSSKKYHADQTSPECDAIICNQKNIALAIKTADCAPILLYDNQNMIFSAIHAGWRGALNDIIFNAVNDMIKIGAKNIEAEIGPMIQADSYEVSNDLYELFTKKNSDYQEFFQKTPKKDKFLFDLNGLIENQLSSLNISKIANNKIDTAKNDDFFSHRLFAKEQQELDGRNISIIF